MGEREVETNKPRKRLLVTRQRKVPKTQNSKQMKGRRRDKPVDSCEEKEKHQKTQKQKRYRRLDKELKNTYQREGKKKSSPVQRQSEESIITLTKRNPRYEFGSGVKRNWNWG